MTIKAIIHKSCRSVQSAPLQMVLVLNVAIYVALKALWLVGGESGIFDRAVNATVIENSFAGMLAHPWSVATYAFVHLDFLHLLVNMLWFACFASVICSVRDRSNVWWLYLTGAVAGALACMAVGGITFGLTRMAGASAAVMCILGATLAYAPRYRIKVALIGDVPLVVVAAVGGLCLFTETGVSMAAHVAGLAAGIIWGLSWRRSQRQVRRVTREAMVRESARKALLDKARTLGYASLSQTERIQLFDMSNGFEKD